MAPGKFHIGDRCPGITIGAGVGRRQTDLEETEAERTFGPEMASQSEHSEQERSQEIKCCWFWTSALWLTEHVAVLRSISFNETFHVAHFTVKCMNTFTCV